MREEYPRKELERQSFISLNGEWDFAFDFANDFLSEYPHFNHTKKQTFEIAPSFERKINVPFVPECELSGINYKKFINACWYRKNISIKKTLNQCIILNFEAVFHTSHLFINGAFVGEHKGGYTPFSFDITDYLNGGENEILLHVMCDARNNSMPSGKQSMTQKPVGCFYERCSGIWAPVWIEIVPQTYIKSIKYTPDIVNKLINIQFNVVGSQESELSVDVYFNNKKVGHNAKRYNGQPQLSIDVPLNEMHLWDVGVGNLYDVVIKLGDDEVKSYFGMRDLVLDSKGLKINGKRVFQRLVLDQGYYQEGMYTAKHEDDFKNDIIISQAMGFNGARLHEKVFERRFLYEADRLGYLCWGEYPSWGFDYTSDNALSIFAPEWIEAVNRDINHPSIIGWCPMNENWPLFGKRQNDLFVKQMYELTKMLDPTRPVIDVSWNYHVKTDIYDVHDYAQGEEFVKHQKSFEDGKIWDSIFKEQAPYNNQPYFISEYGGLKWPNTQEGWGYNGDNKIVSEEDFVNRFKLFQETMFGNPRICASCYTQLYDVQQECNGLYFYSREKKFSEKTINEIKRIMSMKSEYEKKE